ncbi:hypothetical protein K1719_035232 [Acacia pycnantha]|nr:hypothetical protein K1719_035232 [Acacia pycnantha]
MTTFAEHPANGREKLAPNLSAISASIPDFDLQPNPSGWCSHLHLQQAFANCLTLLANSFSELELVAVKFLSRFHFFVFSIFESSVDGKCFSGLIVPLLFSIILILKIVHSAFSKLRF